MRSGILGRMQIDSVQEWQRLTAAYREKSPEELREIARDFSDLTETAQQALRSEMQSRGLGAPESAHRLTADQPLSEVFSSDKLNEEKSDDVHDYTWKVPLCVCDSKLASQLVQALKRSGIESWTGGPGTVFHDKDWGPERTQVIVAADQLDQARVIASQPIPQDIVEQSETEIPEFVEPKCPKCGSDDVVLEGVDPENTWRCEQCEGEWTDSLPKAEDGTSESAKMGS